MTSRSPRRAAALALFLLSVACRSAEARAQEAEAPPTATAGLVELVERYRTDRGDLRGFYAVDPSPTRAARLAALDAGTRASLLALPYEELDAAARIDWHLLRTELEYADALRARRAAQLAAAADALPFAEAIRDLEEARWRLEPVEPRAAARTLTEIAEAAREVKGRLRPSEAEGEAAEDALSLSASEALRVAGWVQSLRRALDTWYRHFDAFEPGFAWWCEEPVSEAREALDALVKALREELAGQKGEDDDPLVGDPIGREALLADLAHEWLAFTPEELIAVGEAEFAWCEARLLEASRELGHGDDWRAALAAVKELHVEPGEQDALVAAQAREMIAWLKERDLVTIPELCEETWRVRMIDERTQRTLPFAAYGGQEMLVAFPTRAMDHEAKLMSLRGNNEHFTRCVTPHELIPGHHLQGFQARRFATHRALFRTPFLVEGWALHWERLEWDLGWPRGPEDRVGMLFWRMHRAARILVSLRFHLGEMSPQEMIDFLVERVGHEVSGATSEVRRYIGGGYSPLYQCGYMIGGLQLGALHEELVGAGLMSQREFHDGVLRQNAIPIELVRAALRGELLPREARPSWRPELRTR